MVAHSHTRILCFSSFGKVYWLKVFEIPQAGRSSRGRPLVNLLPLQPEERITTLLPVDSFEPGRFVFMATAFGTVKKCALEQFARPRSNGLIALDLETGDSLIGAAVTDGRQQVMLFSNAGKAIRFHEDQVRTMGRLARGVRGIRLQSGQRVISLIIPGHKGQILTTCENGYGKRTAVADFPLRNRDGQGIIAMQCNDRNGALVGATEVADGEEIMLITDQGTLVRTRVDEVSIQGRNTQGVRLIKLDAEECLVGLERVLDPGEAGSDGPEGHGDTAESGPE
jgi:DNA gyrase subunit A